MVFGYVCVCVCVCVYTHVFVMVVEMGPAGSVSDSDQTLAKGSDKAEILGFLDCSQ